MSEIIMNIYDDLEQVSGGAGGNSAKLSGPCFIHVVSPNDTLKKIASKYGTSVKELLDLNALPDEGSISVGQHIRVIAK